MFQMTLLYKPGICSTVEQTKKEKRWSQLLLEPAAVLENKLKVPSLCEP